MISTLYVSPNANPEDGPDVASALGWYHFTNFVMARAADFPEAAHLAAFGWSDQLAALEHDLERLPHADGIDPDLTAIAGQVLAALKAAPEGTIEFRATTGEAGEEQTSEGAVRESAPGPPPRPNLVWNDATHRWRNPETGAEHEHHHLPPLDERGFVDQSKVAPEKRVVTFARVNVGDTGRVSLRVLEPRLTGTAEDGSEIFTWDTRRAQFEQPEYTPQEFAAKYPGVRPITQVRDTELGPDARKRLGLPPVQATESIFRERALATKTVIVHRSDGTTYQRQQKVAAGDDDAQADTGGEHHEHELTDTDRQALEGEVANAIPEEAAKSNPGFVHKVKTLALKAAIAGLSVIETWPAAAWNIGTALYALADNVLDTHEDVSKKLGYNPTSSGVAGHATTQDAFKQGFSDLTGADSPISGHIAAKIASVLIVKLAYWAKSKLGGGKSESIEGTDGIDLWANLIAQLLGHLAEEFGTGGAPDRDTVARNLRTLLGSKTPR